MDLFGSPSISIDPPRSPLISGVAHRSSPHRARLHGHGPFTRTDRPALRADWESGAADGGAQGGPPSSNGSFLSYCPLDCQGLHASAHYGRHPCFGRCGRSFRRRRAVTFGRPFPKMGVRTCSRSCRRSGQRKRSGTCAVGSSSRRHEIARDCTRLHAIACDCTSLHAIACDCH